MRRKGQKGTVQLIAGQGCHDGLNRRKEKGKPKKVSKLGIDLMGEFWSCQL